MSSSKLSVDDISVLAGRMVVGHNIPPKNPKEAKEHMKEIERLKHYERQLMEKEAKKAKEHRDALKFAITEWQAVLPTFHETRWHKRTQHLWRHFPIPPCYRGEVWRRAMTASGAVSITDEEYQLLLRKATDRRDRILRRKALVEKRDAGATTGATEEVTDEPFDERMSRILDEDPNYFSPQHGKNETANMIAVDLPRTIITKSEPSQSPTSPRTHSGRSTPMFGSPSGDNGGTTAVTFDAKTSTDSAAGPMIMDSTSSAKTSPGGGSFGVTPSASTGLGSTSTAPSTGGSSTPPLIGTPEVEALMAPNASFCSTTLVEAMGKNESLISRLEMCLRCFVEYRPDMGYIQGMSYLAAMILLNLDDHDAFTVLAALLTHGHFPYFYTVNHQGMSAHIAVFDHVVREGSPEVARNLTVVGVNAQMYVIDWWMSLWSRALPYEVAVRCWDLYMCDDAYLYRISYCLLLYFEHIIHEDAELDEIMSFLSKLNTQYIEEEKFFALVNDPNRGPPTWEIHTFMDQHLQVLEGH